MPCPSVKQMHAEPSVNLFQSSGGRLKLFDLLWRCWQIGCLLALPSGTGHESDRAMVKGSYTDESARDQQPAALPKLESWYWPADTIHCQRQA